MPMLLTASNNATGTAVPIPGPTHRYTNHLFSFYAWGTFGGGTVTIEISPDNTNWFAPTGMTFTAAGAKNAEFKAAWVRASLAGATGGSVNVRME